MSKKHLVAHETAARTLEAALRLRVGRGRTHSVTGIADATGIARRTVESYVQGATPGLSALLSLCAVLGPGFASDILRPCGMVVHTADPDEPAHMQVLTALTGVSAMLAAAVEDGFVDRHEAAGLKPEAERLIALLEPLTRK